MKVVSKEVLRELALKMNFDMKDEEYNHLVDEYAVIHQQIELISKVSGLDNAIPMVAPFDVNKEVIKEDDNIKILEIKEL